MLVNFRRLIIILQAYTKCVTNFGIIPLKSNHFPCNGSKMMQRAPKEPLDYGAVLINFWRQSAQEWRHCGPFCYMTFESKIAFFFLYNFGWNGQKLVFFYHFSQFSDILLEIYTCTLFVASTMVFLKSHCGAINAPIGAKSWSIVAICQGNPSFLVSGPLFNLNYVQWLPQKFVTHKLYYKPVRIMSDKEIR